MSHSRVKFLNTFKWSTLKLGRLLALPPNARPRFERLARDKHYTLFAQSISTKKESFINIVSRYQCYETFYNITGEEAE
jgi:hypothetical protein